jgi:hypothetical protein
MGIILACIKTVFYQINFELIAHHLRSGYRVTSIRMRMLAYYSIPYFIPQDILLFNTILKFILAIQDLTKLINFWIHTYSIIGINPWFTPHNSEHAP